MPNIPSHVSANPVSIGSTNSGSFFCFSSNISMPEANVNISLICREVIPTNRSGPIFIYEVEMNSSFLVVSEYDENTTIAFAYPAAWRNWNDVIELNDIQFEIFVDDVEVPNQIQDISEMGTDLDDERDVDWIFLYDSEFVLFNVSLEAFNNSLIEVNTNFVVSSDSDIFEFDYCVGTGRTWNGSTMEEVRIQLCNTSLYEQNSFTPNDSLTVTQGSDMTTGSWNLNFDSFSENHIGVEIRQKTWPYGPTPTVTPLDSLPVVLAFGAIVSVIAIAIVVFSKRT